MIQNYIGGNYEKVDKNNWKRINASAFEIHNILLILILFLKPNFSVRGHLKKKVFCK